MKLKTDNYPALREGAAAAGIFYGAENRWRIRTTIVCDRQDEEDPPVEPPEPPPPPPLSELWWIIESPLPDQHIDTECIIPLDCHHSETTVICTNRGDILPPGLWLDNDIDPPQLRGWPTVEGTSAHELRLTDPTGHYADRWFTITILPPLPPP